LTINANDAVSINRNVTANSVAVHSGIDGTGDTTFGPAVTIQADTQSYRAGDGPAGRAPPP
jgi:hypothetical protein